MINPDFWRGKRVFLTGHTGFKGAWLLKILEQLCADVTGYALPPQGEINLFDICRPKVNSVIGDVRDFKSLKKAYQKAEPEIVIHMAAQPLVLRSYREPRYTYETNIMGTVNLLECARSGARSVLNVTTDKVYLNLERDIGYTEDDKLGGFDPYSNSKSCSELVSSCYGCSFLKENGIAISTARSGNVIGGGDFADDRLIPDCARSASSGEVIKIRNPASIRPYQHVLDTISAYLLIAERQYGDSSLSGAYNIGPAESSCASSGELAGLFCKSWQGASWQRVSIYNPHESAVLKLDCAKIKGTLGWEPKWDIERSVREAALWYKGFYENGQSHANAVMAGQIEEFLR